MDIRICQYFYLVASNNTQFSYQNYFVNEAKFLQPSTASSLLRFDFVPFRAEGSISSLNGDNNILQVLFPNTELSLRLLDSANSNRLSRLVLTTMWVNSAGNELSRTTEFYIGVGSSISETTLELRFRSAIDSVASNFPARTLTRELVGILPLDSQIVMR